MNITDIIKEFENIQNYGNATLTAILCLAIGYVWRGMKFKWFPNEAIPAILVLFVGPITFSVLSSATAPEKHLVNWYFRAALVGAAVGFAVTLVHNYAIKGLEEWLGSKVSFIGNLLGKEQKQPTEGKVETKP
jgi:hypothetical protein